MFDHSLHLEIDDHIEHEEELEKELDNARQLISEQSEQLSQQSEQLSQKDNEIANLKAELAKYHH